MKKKKSVISIDFWEEKNLQCTFSLLISLDHFTTTAWWILERCCTILSAGQYGDYLHCSIHKCQSVFLFWQVSGWFKHLTVIDILINIRQGVSKSDTVGPLKKNLRQLPGDVNRSIMLPWSQLVSCGLQLEPCFLPYICFHSDILVALKYAELTLSSSCLQCTCGSTANTG